MTNKERVGMTERIIGKVLGMPVYEGDGDPLGRANRSDLSGWFIHVLIKRDPDFAFEHAVMGIEYIKENYDIRALTARYNKLTGNTMPQWTPAPP